MTLESLARNELSQVTVTIAEPSGFPGSVWNDGEYAYVNYTVNNTSGVLLRDVVIDFDASQSAYVAPIFIFGISIYDGDEFVDELEPGDSRTYIVRLRASAAGNAHVHVTISAEVVPYASRHAAFRNITIIAA